MSSEIEKLYSELSHKLGWDDRSMLRARPYTGQPHTVTGVRGASEIYGITFRDLRDCFFRAVCQAHPLSKRDGHLGEYACISQEDIHDLPVGQLSLVAAMQNLCVEVEKLMGIYPNIPALQHSPTIVLETKPPHPVFFDRGFVGAGYSSALDLIAESH